MYGGEVAHADDSVAEEDIAAEAEGDEALATHRHPSISGLHVSKTAPPEQLVSVLLVLSYCRFVKSARQVDKQWPFAHSSSCCSVSMAGHGKSSRSTLMSLGPSLWPLL
jgi:hypothetical protein